MSRIYKENFKPDCGGWIGWGTKGTAKLEMSGGAVVSRSPWWVDYNHAPPGGGYLHLLFALHTTLGPGARWDYKEWSGINRFVSGGFPLDFTNARVTVRLRGEVELRGAELLFLIQAEVGAKTINYVLNKQPFEITPGWTEQSITLVPDPDQWKCMGSRKQRMDFYGWDDVSLVLKDLNVDIILVLHPLDIRPLDTIEEDPHELRAGIDYPLNRNLLPTGFVMMDEIEIRFA